MKIMEIDFQDYQLSSQLYGHQHDVRRICVCDNAGIATSSRDKTVRFWGINPRNKNRYVESKVLVGHTSFVGPLAWISPNQEFPEGGIVSGGMDTLVCVWDLKTGDRVQVLRGHTMQVTGIVLDNGDIVSSSID
ncbi:hypothetical protein KSS87_005704, partial [Heliosperma pusillum]